MAVSVLLRKILDNATFRESFLDKNLNWCILIILHQDKVRK